MKRLLSVMGVLVSVAVSHAQSFTSNLDPFQEVPPHNTPGYGAADLTLSGTTLSIDLNTGTYADLLAGATVVRLQDAAVGANGPTLGTFTLDTPGNTSGTFSGSVAGLTTAQVNDLLAGNFYLNIADSVFPSGEIRGQIEMVPEPSTFVLLGTGSLALLARWRRKV